MSHRRVAEVANFICKFGDQINLIDRAEEIVLPALLDTNLRRTYGESSYFFLDTQLLVIPQTDNEKIFVVSGRFVKDTRLSAEQIYDAGTLVSSTDSIPSAPSLFFVLILNNHRIIFLKETSHAPSITSFRATLLRFLSLKRTQYIRSQTTNATQTTPKPNLEIIQLASPNSMLEFIQKFSQLKKVEFRVFLTNNEIDCDPMFDQIRVAKQAVYATKTILVHSSPTGLNKNATATQVASATRRVNIEAVLTGIDEQNNELKGSNADFSLKIPYTTPDEDDIARTKTLVEQYCSQERAGIVTESEREANIANRLRNIFSRLVRHN